MIRAENDITLVRVDDGIQGEPGADGYSPTVTTGTSEDGSTTVTVTNKDGSNTTTLVDGKARTDINNLEIGGRNLILKSETKPLNKYIDAITTQTGVEVSEWGTNKAIRSYGVCSSSTIFGTLATGASSPRAASGQAYVHSIYVKNNGETAIRINNNNLGDSLTIQPGESTRVILYGTGDGTHYLQFVFLSSNLGDAFDVTYWHPKIEIGDKATDWTPAPEDVQAEIDSIKKRVVIGDDSVDIVDSTGRLLASYGDAKIELGKNAVSSIIEMCGGMARVSARYGGLTTIYSNSGGYQTTLDYDFNESKFKSKVGSNYGSYEFIYSGGVWECSYSGNNAGYVQVNLSAYGITLKTTSVNEYAGITINYWNGSEATFINADTTKPSRKLILGLAESGTSDNADYANIEIERSKEGNVEHSKINLLTVHDGANVAGVYLDNGNVELNASGEVLINQYNIVQRLIDMLCCADTESITVTAGTFTNGGCSATLVGNTLYLYLNAKAKAAITAGNIANQTMLTIKFTDDRILALYSASCSGGAAGPNSQMQFSATSSGGQHTITVTLAAIAQNIAKDGVINAHVSMPCVLNWDAY